MNLSKQRLLQIIREEIATVRGSVRPPHRRQSLERAIQEEVEAYLAEEDDSFSKAGEEIEKKGTEGAFTAKASRKRRTLSAFCAAKSESLRGPWPRQ